MVTHCRSSLPLLNLVYFIIFMLTTPPPKNSFPHLLSSLTWNKVAQSCLTLCDPMDCSLPGSSIHGIFQARVLEWVAISYSRGSSWPRDWTQVSRIAGRYFTIWATREAHHFYHAFLTCMCMCVCLCIYTQVCKYTYITNNWNGLWQISV